MKPLDFAKAFGLGVLLLALNILLLVAIVFAYSQAFARGQAPAFYTALAERIGNWSAPITGIILLFLTAWVFGARRKARNAYLFGFAVYASYFAVDTASGLAMGPLSTLLVPPFLVAIVGGAVAIAAGAHLSRR